MIYKPTRRQLLKHGVKASILALGVPTLLKLMEREVRADVTLGTPIAYGGAGMNPATVNVTVSGSDRYILVLLGVASTGVNTWTYDTMTWNSNENFTLLKDSGSSFTWVRWTVHGIVPSATGTHTISIQLNGTPGYSLIEALPMSNVLSVGTPADTVNTSTSIGESVASATGRLVISLLGTDLGNDWASTGTEVVTVQAASNGVGCLMAQYPGASSVSTSWSGTNSDNYLVGISFTPTGGAPSSRVKHLVINP